MIRCFELIEEFQWYIYNHSYLYRQLRYLILYVLNIRWYWYIATIGIIIAIGIFSRVHKLSREKTIVLGVIIPYIFLLYASLVFSRPSGESYQYNIIVLWSLKAVISGEYKYIREIVLNLMMLTPVGILLPIIKKNALWIVSISCLLSITIELLQLFTKTGLCEVDDVIYNTISAGIGYCIYKFCEKIKNGGYDEGAS